MLHAPQAPATAGGRAPTPPGWLGFAWLVLLKDLRIERKSGEIVATSGFFAILVAVMASGGREPGFGGLGSARGGPARSG